ncbi:hypothetical protein [Flavobacterium psychrophilum]|nr:hypothetical protein [Flavobacterium psychrophilum]EKT4510214.1 hypothetical protein [Flavobacterium psychrophilum]
MESVNQGKNDGNEINRVLIYILESEAVFCTDVQRSFEDFLMRANPNIIL